MVKGKHPYSDEAFAGGRNIFMFGSLVWPKMWLKNQVYTSKVLDFH
jgi:hypothetical protein